MCGARYNCVSTVAHGLQVRQNISLSKCAQCIRIRDDLVNAVGQVNRTRELHTEQLRHVQVSYTCTHALACALATPSRLK